VTTNSYLQSEWRTPEDDLRVTRWRAERLVTLGYGHREAARLASSKIDIHELARLIAMGCPASTAVRIAA
jgi:hypothetical protein